jgi:GMP reductase
MIKNLTYRDITLPPQKCLVSSREDCDTSVQFGPYKFAMPVYPANMKSVVDEKTCEYLASKGWFYTMHRFGGHMSDFICHMHDMSLPVSISTGVHDVEEDMRAMLSSGQKCDYITIDVANAWSEMTHEAIKIIRKFMPDVFLIAGNVATIQAVEEIQTWGVDAIKVGIAGGKVCITRNKTGFCRGMVTAVEDCVSVAKVPIIADGGIEHNGDVAKALACGATMVMAGFLFSGYDMSAGEIIEINDQQFKEYYGSASKYNKKELKNIEGKKILIPYRGSMERLLEELVEDLQSAISYAGGKDLSAFSKIDYELASAGC